MRAAVLVRAGYLFILQAAAAACMTDGRRGSVTAQEKNPSKLVAQSHPSNGRALELQTLNEPGPVSPSMSLIAIVDACAWQVWEPSLR